MAQSFIANTLTQITTAASWTEVAGATKGLSGTILQAEIDIFLQNWDADQATILFAITANSTMPTLDTQAFYRTTLAADGVAELQAILTGTEHLWVKSDQTDTRVNITGTKETA